MTDSACRYPAPVGSSIRVAVSSPTLGQPIPPETVLRRVELCSGAKIADDDQVVVLRVLAARAEVRRARAQKSAVNLLSLEVHERTAALDPDVVGEVAELDEVMTLARVENDSNVDAAPYGRVERVEHDRVRNQSESRMP